MEPFIAQIVMFGGNFAPRGWAFCDGQLLAISQNTALFSILGTTYGGDGRTTFALPDLRGRAPIGEGQGPGLSVYRLGQRGGQETHTLNTTEMPNHNHSLIASSDAGTSPTPTGNYIATHKVTIERGNTVDGESFNSGGNLGQMNGNSIGNNGGNLAHNNMQPYLAVNYIIALVGVFPSRS
ncbi:phage tail protein [Algoriphagus machipongonensis]|uniref:Phage tail collar domain protein n=1 Tax=Algoriphagus machipongonensis TaxID=388413 RepID=A3HS56_9BACT|nr:tail fiber protein [Algoriphagus machipongonensis]EAZ82674.1 phage tail collar domain protein [Algoriphagus machipongonensis]